MSAVLAALAGLLVFATAWEVMGSLGSPRGRQLVRATPASRLGSARDALADRLDARRRLARAGLAERISARGFVGAKLTGSVAGALGAFFMVPATTPRLAPLLAVALVPAGFVAPDAWAERLARRRRATMVGALPDALDLVAVGAATGRTPVALLSEVARRTTGPLAAELSLALAEIEAGAPQAEALKSLRKRTGASELGAVADALERSRRYGSPLAEQLYAQAAALRVQEQRLIEERAARAAPKIQLVIAMVLVPSALLAIAAALVAYSGSLFSAF